MKKALKFKRTYLFSFLLTLIGIGLPFVIWGFVYFFSGNRDFPYHMTLLIMGLSFLLLGLILGDIPLIIFRIKTDELDPEVSDELKTNIWLLRWPFVFSGLATLIAIGIIGIIYLITKTWPLF